MFQHFEVQNLKFLSNKRLFSYFLVRYSVRFEYENPFFKRIAKFIAPGKKKKKNKKLHKIPQDLMVLYA